MVQTQSWERRTIPPPAVIGGTAALAGGERATRPIAHTKGKSLVSFRKRISAATIAAFATLGMIVGTAFAAQYEETGTLSHDGYCVGYGWGNSAYGSGVYSGTNWTAGGGPCYRKQDAYFEYNTVDVYNPANTGWQTYDLFQGAGPEGSCDVEVTTHWFSWTGGGSVSGNTSADDGC